MNFFHYHHPYGYPYYSYEPYFESSPYNDFNMFSMPYWNYGNPHGGGDTQNVNNQWIHPYITNPHELSQNLNRAIDRGPAPFTVDIEEATKQNSAFRTVLWTGQHLQVTLMSLQPGEDIGLEIHPHADQFLRIEKGEGIVEMGRTPNLLNYRMKIKEDTAIMVPAGTWHNVTNTGKIPMKLYSIYAPPQHPRGAIHRTKADAMAQERRHSHQ